MDPRRTFRRLACSLLLVLALVPGLPAVADNEAARDQSVSLWGVARELVFFWLVPPLESVVLAAGPVWDPNGRSEPPPPPSAAVSPTEALTDR